MIEGLYWLLMAWSPATEVGEVGEAVYVVLGRIVVSLLDPAMRGCDAGISELEFGAVK